MRILLVEDSEDLGEAIEKRLRGAGHSVEWVRDGAEVAAAAQAEPFDAVALDLTLPNRDGIVLLAELRREKFNAPILVITARSEIDDKVSLLDLGADDYLVKPFDLRELEARLRALIRRSQGHAEPVLRFDRVTIDTAKRFVILDGLPVDLTPREYSLVEYLAFRRGHVVTRTELYEHLFAEEDESCSNLLDVHVCKVRHKLGSEFIRTHRGHGYSIAED